MFLGANSPDSRHISLTANTGQASCARISAEFVVGGARPALQHLEKGSKKGGDRNGHRPNYNWMLPAGLLDTGQFASVRHLAEAYTGDAELLERSTRTAIDGVAVTNAYR